MRKKINKKATKTLGADQGMKTVLTLSDHQVTPLTDDHGHSLESIIDKMRVKKKGSKAFGKLQDHRTNFINWSINKLNFKHIKTLKLEDVNHLRYKTSYSRKMSHWVYTDIRDKVASRCELEDVLLVPNESTYMSQRCHVCGLVLKSNRKGKVYSCKNCGYEGDSDYNSSCNHQLDLPDISDLRSLRLNIKGFFWKLTGVYSLEGEELSVPLSKKLGKPVLIKDEALWA